MQRLSKALEKCGPLGWRPARQWKVFEGGSVVLVTGLPVFVADATAVVLPGVGAFGACMSALRRAGLEDVAHHAVASGRPFLGVCVGMQMLFDGSEEDPAHTGLGIIPGRVCWLGTSLPRPQMQWNRLDIRCPDALFDGLGSHPWMYFVHSYVAEVADPADIAATCDYGTPLTAAVARGRLWATQFHPEKSGTNGLRLLDTYVQTLT